MIRLFAELFGHYLAAQQQARRLTAEHKVHVPPPPLAGAAGLDAYLNEPVTGLEQWFASPIHERNHSQPERPATACPLFLTSRLPDRCSSGRDSIYATGPLQLLRAQRRAARRLLLRVDAEVAV